MQEMAHRLLCGMCAPGAVLLGAVLGAVSACDLDLRRPSGLG
jgi:hypothetical protein